MEKLDCVVIGAGWYGLAAAKQYHELHPGGSLAVMESSPTVGGVWAEHRLYPGLKSNNMLGTYEYPDFPMEPTRFDIKPGQHIPGKVIHTYHKAYASHFGFLDLIRLRTKVVSAEHQPDGGWILTVQRGFDVLHPDAALPNDKVFARRLVVATGLTSNPFLPHIDGQEAFGAPLFHAKDFLRHADTVDPAKTRRATVFGGTKNAWDAAYAYATAGVQVDWVIRESGHGACWMAPPYVTPLKKWLEKLVNIRLLTWFSPCVWSGDAEYGTRVRSLLHGTAVGRAICRTFWKILGGDVISLCKFDSHPEMAKLKPKTDAFFAGCSFSILNYDTDFFELVRNGKIKVHVADISHLGPHEVHLADGEKTVLQSDALLLVTGWTHAPPLKFLPEGIEKELGMPHLVPGEASATDLGSQRTLFDRADAEILSRFPRLRDPGTFNAKYVPLSEQKGIRVVGGESGITPTSATTPFLLYHFITPPQEKFLRNKDIAFSGFNMNFSNAMTAHLEGLWISAFFDGKLARDPSAAVGAARGSGAATLEQLQYDTVLHNRMGKWRYPYDYGAKHPDFVFDAVPFMDMLLADLGLKVHRKKTWLKEITEPYGPEDYRDVNDEWERKYGQWKQSASSVP